jgi:hypothetical protein
MMKGHTACTVRRRSHTSDQESIVPQTAELEKGRTNTISGMQLKKGSHLANEALSINTHAHL